MKKILSPRGLIPILVLPLLLLEGFAQAVAAPDLGRLRDLERSAVSVLERVKPAFVFIEGGSGFLVSEDGYVLTNDHVVADKTGLIVQLTGGRTYRADVVGHDPEGDVALLKIQPSGEFPPRAPGGEPVKPLELGDSGTLRVGQPVIALGDPFLVGSKNLFLELAPPDYEPSASLGIVSALHRFSDTYSDAIQVDVAVNRGNSGGPLLTLDGKVVGINGKIETRFDIGINTGVGYAVPSNQILRFLEPLKKAGGRQVRHGSIHGIDLAERSEGSKGLLIRRLRPGSPADLAGIEEGDRIVSIDALPVPSRNRYLGILGTYPAGSEVLLGLARGTGTLDVRVTLLEAGALPYVGMKTQQVVEGESRTLNILEVLPGSPAERAGLLARDVIVFFDGKKVETTTDLKLLIQRRSAGDEVPVSVLREGKTVEAKVRLGGKSE